MANNAHGINNFLAIATTWTGQVINKMTLQAFLDDLSVASAPQLVTNNNPHGGRGYIQGDGDWLKTSGQEGSAEPRPQMPTASAKPLLPEQTNEDDEWASDFTHFDRATRVHQDQQKDYHAIMLFLDQANSFLADRLCLGALVDIAKGSGDVHQRLKELPFDKINRIIKHVGVMDEATIQGMKQFYADIAAGPRATWKQWSMQEEILNRQLQAYHRALPDPERLLAIWAAFAGNISVMQAKQDFEKVHVSMGSRTWKNATAYLDEQSDNIEAGMLMTRQGIGYIAASHVVGEAEPVTAAFCSRTGRPLTANGQYINHCAQGMFTQEQVDHAFAMGAQQNQTREGIPTRSEDHTNNHYCWTCGYNGSHGHMINTDAATGITTHSQASQCRFIQFDRPCLRHYGDSRSEQERDMESSQIRRFGRPNCVTVEQAGAATSPTALGNGPAQIGNSNRQQPRGRSQRQMVRLRGQPFVSRHGNIDSSNDRRPDRLRR
jgi:hypothetical protein